MNLAAVVVAFLVGFASCVLSLAVLIYGEVRRIEK